MKRFVVKDLLKLTVAEFDDEVIARNCAQALSVYGVHYVCERLTNSPTPRREKVIAKYDLCEDVYKPF